MPKEDKTAGTVWGNDEIEIIVEDYLEILQIELAGERLNKAKRHRTLQERIRRSRGSIEYKHRNISAVMATLGLPFVAGYKPASNFQTRLFEVIEEKVLKGDLADRLSTQVREPSVSNAALTLQEPPINNPVSATHDPIVRRTLRAFDPAARDARARLLGEAGEEFLFHAEQNRLSAAGKDDLANRVRWVSKEDGDGAGFDILSFSEGGEERWLEAKTTNGPRTTPFWISENELRVSEKRRDVFRLVRLYDFSRMPAAYQLKPPLADFVHLTPTKYFATLR